MDRNYFKGYLISYGKDNTILLVKDISIGVLVYYV